MATTMGDDLAEGTVSSLDPDLLEFGYIGGMLSQEDVAWADSCLIKYPEVSDIDWNSLTDALLGAYISPPDSLDAFVSGAGGSPGATEAKILSSSERTGTSEVGQRTFQDTGLPNGKVEKGSEDHLVHEEVETLSSRFNLENVFLPTYNEDSREIGTPDSEVDFSFPAFVMEQSDEDIFKVWDLLIPAEEEELIEQLNKALAENTLETTPSTSDDSQVWKGLKDASLDDLVSGIAELSLSQNPV